MAPTNSRLWRALLGCTIATLLIVLAVAGTALVTQPRFASLSGVRSAHGQPVAPSSSMTDSALAQSTAAGLLGRSSVVMQGRVQLNSSSVPALALSTLDAPAAAGFDVLRGAWPTDDDHIAVSPALRDLYGLETGTIVAVAGQAREIVGVVEDRNALGAVRAMTTAPVLYAKGEVTQLLVYSAVDVADLRFADQGVAGTRVPWTTAPQVRSEPHQNLLRHLLLASAAVAALSLVAHAASLNRAPFTAWRSLRDSGAGTAVGFACAAGVLRIALPLAETLVHRRLHWTVPGPVTVGAAVGLSLLLAFLLMIDRRESQRGRAIVPVAAAGLAVALVLGFAAVEPEPLAEAFNRNGDQALGAGLGRNTVLIGDQADLTEFAGSVDLADLERRMQATLPADGFEVAGLTVAAGSGSGAFVTAQSTNAAAPLGLAGEKLFTVLGCADSIVSNKQLLVRSDLERDPQGYRIGADEIPAQSISPIDCHALTSPLLPDLWTPNDRNGAITTGIVVKAVGELTAENLTRIGLASYPVAVTTRPDGGALPRTLGRLTALLGMGLLLGIVVGRAAAGSRSALLSILAALSLGALVCGTWLWASNFTTRVEVPTEPAATIALGALVGSAYLGRHRARRVAPKSNADPNDRSLS